MAFKVRGGVMNITGSAHTIAAIEIDMRDLLRAKKSKPSNEGERAGDDLSGLVLRISSRSLQEIDHLIEGLQGVREKLDNDWGRLQHEIVKYAALNESIIELTKIISDGMAFVNKGPTAAPVASPSLRPTQ
jgi:hypothetical protein